MNKLDQTPTADLGACTSIAEMSEAEGWTPQDYTIALSATLANVEMPLDISRERLAALGSIGAGLAAVQASADTLAQHVLILDALMSRFALEAHAALTRNTNARAPETAERYLNAAIKASRAALATMSALSILRSHANPTSTATLLPPQTVQPASAPLFLVEAK